MQRKNHVHAASSVVRVTGRTAARAPVCHQPDPTFFCTRNLSANISLTFFFLSFFCFSLPLPCPLLVLFCCFFIFTCIYVYIYIYTYTYTIIPSKKVHLIFINDLYRRQVLHLYLLSTFHIYLSVTLRVGLRVRPLTEKERLSNCSECVSYIPNEPQVLIGTEKSFTYDYVFNSEASQAQVFSAAALPLLEKFIEG